MGKLIASFRLEEDPVSYVGAIIFTTAFKTHPHGKLTAELIRVQL